MMFETAPLQPLVEIVSEFLGIFGLARVVELESRIDRDTEFLERAAHAFFGPHQHRLAEALRQEGMRGADHGGVAARMVLRSPK